MKNWHEWDIWTSLMFNPGDESVDRLFATFMWIIVMAIPTVFSSLYISMITPWLLFVTIPLGLFVVYKAPIMYKHHVLYGVSGVVATRHARFYYGCSKDERALYPAKVVNTFKDWHLFDYSQKVMMDGALDSLEAQIKDRRAVYEKALAKRIDINDVVEEIKRQTQYVKIEVDTYKEFM